MEKTSKELLKEFVNSQQFTSTTDIMNSIKEPFGDVQLIPATHRRSADVVFAHNVFNTVRLPE